MTLRSFIFRSVVTELTGTSISVTFIFTGIKEKTGAIKSVFNGRFFIGL